MKKNILILLSALALLSACQSEKKSTYYSDIYQEKPVCVLVTPVDDQTERRAEKYPKDAAWNNELNTTTQYLFQTLPAALLSHGYYVPGPVTCSEIHRQINLTPRQWRNASLTALSQDWGIDAVINTTLIRWREENGRWIAYLEYQMRSTKTGNELFHKWVKAVKEVPTNLKGDPIALKQDRSFAKRLGCDNGTAQRCFLMEKVNDYVMRNIPISSTRRQFENDLYKNASPTYILYTWTDEGKSDVQTLSIEQFESEAFI